MIKNNLNLVSPFLLLLILGLNTSIGQVINDRATQVNTNKALVDIMSKIQGLDNAAKTSIDGSPYLYEGWSTGSIIIHNSVAFKGIKLKFNLYNEQLIYFDEGAEDTLAVNMNFVKEFTIYGADTLRFVRDNLLEKNFDRRFFQLLYSGKESLLKVLKKDLLQFDSDSSSPTSSPPRLIDRSTLLLVNKNEFCEIKKSRRKSMACFDDPRKELERFVKANKINFGDEKDVVKVFKAYDTFY